MTRGRIIFYSIFGAYQLLAFIFTVIMETSASLLFKLVGFVGWFKFITFFGVVLIAVDFIWLWMDNRRNKKAHDTFREENNVLKAKVYDYQEASKPKPEVPKSN